MNLFFSLRNKNQADKFNFHSSLIVNWKALINCDFCYCVNKAENYCQSVLFVQIVAAFHRIIKTILRESLFIAICRYYAIENVHRQLSIQFSVVNEEKLWTLSIKNHKM